MEGFMSKIAILTDSTVNLPENFVKDYSITVLPQVLIWGEQIFEDGIDITPAAFYNRLKSSKQSPSTSQVTPKSFLSAFADLLAQDYQILCILVGEKLSGTISSALQAKESYLDAPIAIV